MEANNTVCPVCTLYLRPGITLKSHLASHPKQKVIDALVKLSHVETEKQVVSAACPGVPGSSQPWHGLPPNTPITAQPNMSGNHSFIYQQFMSSSAPQSASNVMGTVNQLGQQYVTVPTVFNLQMMCPPYVYQQQQVIMSSGGSQMPAIPRLLPIEENVDAADRDDMLLEDYGEEQEPDLVIVEHDQEDASVAGYDGNTGETGDGEKEEVKDQDVEKLDFTDQIIVGDKILRYDQPLELLNVGSPQYDEQDREMGSPCSNASSDFIRVRKDLNKSIQTQTMPEAVEPVFDEQKGEPFDDPEDLPASYATLTNPDHTPIVDAMLVSTEHQAGVNVIDMDGMNLMLNSEFAPGQIIAQVDDFEYTNRCERPRVLMNIGDYSVGDESVSVDSTNIRADEHMPPRGELSGQESNASDMAWSRIDYNTNSHASASYDLLARETWDGSDASDTDVPPLQSRDPVVYDDVPTISGYLEPPIQYRCPTCGENFTCPKERRVHQAEAHQKDEPVKEVGTRIGKKKVKKIVIKPKKEVVKTENNFDNMFKPKVEANEADSERSTVILESKAILEVDKVDKLEDPLLILNPTVCTLCGAVLADNALFKQHQADVHNFGSEERYKCAVCLEAFSCESKYTEHLRVHPLECRICGKYFFRRQNMQLHMKRHLGIRPYKCNVCEKSFLTKQKMDEHRNVHTGEAPIKCNLCDETFRRHSNLVQHRNRHHYNMKKKLKDYICACGEVFHSKKKLAWHREIHDNKPKACTQCSEKFIHAASLTRHMRRAHNERFVPQEERRNENVECPICKGVYLRSSLDVHIRNHSGQRPFSCLICNKDFTTKWNLKLHKWTHAARANKPFKCDMCRGAFIRESDYVAHMNSHKSIKPYTCNYCGAQFIRKYNCQRHVREHEKTKTFNCQVCGKSFHRSYYLKDHMRVHSGVRPFACHICGKTSTTKSNHNKHIRIHHAREPVSTEN